jgi:predicted transcriptional regulator
MTTTEPVQTGGGDDIRGWTVDLAKAFVANNSVPAAELPTLLTSIQTTLCGMGSGGGGMSTTAMSASGGEQTTRATPSQIRKSITPDHLISFEDGKPYKSLKRHLGTRGLTHAQYREKWGLPSTYPTTAPNYSKARSELAKKMGLGNARRGQTTASTTTEQQTKTRSRGGGRRKAA